MSWKCPACSSGIRFSDYDHVLRGRPYYCPTCGLALVLNKSADNLVAAPATTIAPDKREPARTQSANQNTARPPGGRRRSDR